MGYAYHIDGGHGWLAVPLINLERSGFAPSRFSYIDRPGQIAYLEEDCDMPGYLEAIGAIPGDPRLTTIDDGVTSPIRRLPRFPAEVKA